MPTPEFASRLARRCHALAFSECLPQPPSCSAAAWVASDTDKAGGEQHPDAVVLTLANHDPDTNDLDEFAREVARQSDGALRIEFKNRWRPGRTAYEPQTIEDVRDGKIDLAKVGARAFDLAGVRSLQPLVAPLAVDSYALERRVLGSPLAARMLQGVDRIDLVGIALLPGDLRKPLGISRALVGAADYRGATIGTRPSAMGGRTFRALGARPEFYASGGDISAFDGTEAGLTGVEGDRLDGPAQTLALNVNLWPRVLAVVMNRDAYDALSDDQREALRAAGRAALGPAIGRVQQFDKEALGILCSRGEVAVRSATPSQLDALRAATTARLGRPRAEPRDPECRARRSRAMRADVQAEPAPTCSTGAGEHAKGDATPVDGLWRMTSTESRVRRDRVAGGCRARELGGVQVRLRQGSLRDDDGEWQGLRLGVRQLRGQGGSCRMDDRGWRRTQRDRGEFLQPAGRVLHLSLEPVSRPAHADAR